MIKLRCKQKQSKFIRQLDEIRFVKSNSKTEDVLATGLWIDYGRSRSLESRNKLVERYRGLSKSIAAKYCTQRFTMGELLSYADEGLIRAVMAFDPSRGVSFAGYATQRIAGSIRDYIRNECGGRQRRRVKMPHITTMSTESLRKENWGNEPPEFAVEDGALRGVDDADEWGHIANRFTHELRPVVLGVGRDGKFQCEIADDLGCSASRVSLLMTEVRKQYDAAA